MIAQTEKSGEKADRQCEYSCTVWKFQNKNGKNAGDGTGGEVDERFHLLREMRNL